MAKNTDRGKSAQSAPAVLARFTSFARLSPQELEWLRSIAGPPKPYRRGMTIRSDGQRAQSLDLLVEGWASSAVLTSDGQRQLISINLPGDLLGLPALAVADSLDAVVALSSLVVREIRIEDLSRIFTEHPRLAALLFLISQEERALAMERLALMGRTGAKARLAALFIRLRERITPPDDSTPDRFHCYLTQQDMADLIGVTTVHLNAVLGELKAAGLVTLHHRQLTILNYPALLDTAGLAPWRLAQPDWLPQHRPAE